MTLASFKTTRPVPVSSLVAFEDESPLTRAVATLLAGDGAARTVTLGTPLGKISESGAVSAASAAVAGNTGTGTLTLADPAFAASAKLGIYTVNCTVGGADAASKFRVEDPDGTLVGTATGGAAFDKAVKFTIAGGGTDFVVGDAFTVILSQAAGADDGKVKEWDPDAVDGSEIIWGFSLRETTAADGVDNVGGVLALRREAVLVAESILWPDAVSDAQKAAAIADIEDRLFLIVR